MSLSHLTIPYATHSLLFWGTHVVQVELDAFKRNALLTSRVLTHMRLEIDRALGGRSINDAAFESVRDVMTIIAVLSVLLQYFHAHRLIGS